MNGFGCGCDTNRSISGLGAIDHNGFVTLGFAPGSGGSGDTYRDLGIGLAAFVTPIVYDKLAPKRWPHTKKLWQDVGVVIGLYFLGTYVARKVI